MSDGWKTLRREYASLKEWENIERMYRKEKSRVGIGHGMMSEEKTRKYRVNKSRKDRAIVQKQVTEAGQIVAHWMDIGTRRTPDPG